MNNLISISANVNNLVKVRHFVQNYLHNCNINEKDANLLILAVDEVLANRILHSVKSNESIIIDIEIVHDTNGICFKITDTGDFYDIVSHPDPNLSELIALRKKGGVGLMLVKKIMDSVKVEKKDPFVVLTLFKNIKTTTTSLSHS